MRLQAVRFKHHRVLGDVHISLFDGKHPRPLDAIPDTTVELAVNNEEAANHYTFVIGDNGVGKSFFFKTIVHAMNLGAAIDPRHSSIDDLNQDDSESGTKEILDKSIPALQKLGVFTNLFPHPLQDKRYSDFLQEHDAQLILVSSTFEEKITHRNARFRSFNFLSSINTTNILLLRALYRHQGNSKIKTLSKLLGFAEDANWKVGYQLPIYYKGENGDGTMRIVLDTTRDATIPDFLRVLADLTTDEKHHLMVRNRLADRDYSVMYDIYKSGTFFKLFFDYEGPQEDFFQQIADNWLLRQLNDFMQAIAIDDVQTRAGNFNVTDRQLSNWEIELDITRLNLFDINLIALMLEHRVISMNVSVNGISVDDLSSGQKNLIRLFSLFADMPIRDKTDNCIVFFDEPENSLHPSWQQEFPVNFRAIVEEVYGITNSHFLFATHSPVLIMKAASLPNTNVLKFYKDDTRNLQADEIAYVNAFSIEEVLLDEFKISYRDQGAEAELKKFLDGKADSAADPINSIRNSFALREKINELYNQIEKGK